MQTIFKPAFLNSLAQYADKENFRSFVSILITGLIVLAGFKAARDVLAAVMMKLYELLIQKNAAGL